MKRWWTVLIALAAVLAAQPYSYDSYKAELLKLITGKKAQKVLSLSDLERFIPKECSSQPRALVEKSNKVGGKPSPPLVVYSYGKGGQDNREGATLTVTLVDYGGLASKDRVEAFDIGPRLYDPKKNPAWKQPTNAYKPNPQTIGFSYVTDTKDAAIRLVVAGRFDLRLEHNNTNSLKPLEACLAKINLAELVRTAAR